MLTLSRVIPMPRCILAESAASEGIGLKVMHSSFCELDMRRQQLADG
jgi:hypothetical protein